MISQLSCITDVLSEMKPYNWADRREIKVSIVKVDQNLHQYIRNADLHDCGISI